MYRGRRHERRGNALEREGRRAKPALPLWALSRGGFRALKSGALEAMRILLHSSSCITAVISLEVLIAILGFTSVAGSVTLRVPSQYTTISTALHSLGDGDTVLVEPGTYSEPLSIPDSTVTLLSTAGAASTVLDGTSTPTVSMVTLNSAGQAVFRMRGFTVTGVSAAAAISVSRATVNIEDCVIRDNASIGVYSVATRLRLADCSLLRNDAWKGYPSFGGALSITTYVDGPTRDATIERCEIGHNHAGFGGGLSAQATSLAIEDCKWIANSSVYDGGAIFLWPKIADSTISTCLFEENEGGDHGGAIAAWHYIGGMLLVRHSAFLRNLSRADDSQGINGSGGAIHISGYAGVIENNTFEDNRSAFAGRGGTLCIDFTSVGYPYNWTIQQNIITGSQGGGVVCTGIGGDVSVVDNLYFGNDINMVVDPTCTPHTVRDNLDADPWFCSPGAEDIRVAANSPALVGSTPIGASAEPGCSAVPVVITTWGSIKALFGRH